MSALPPVSLIVGDSFLAEDKAKTLIASFSKKIKGEISQKNYRLSEKDIDSVLTEARTLPFLASAQIFRLRDSQILKKKDIESLKAYLEKPATTSSFIFEADSLTKDAPLVKLLIKHGEIFFLDDRSKRSAATALIKQKLRSFGKTMTPGALSRLEGEAEVSPAFLDSTLEQLMAYAGQKTQITEEMVEAFEENWTQTDVFKLTGAIISRKTDEAMIVFRRILEEGEQDLIALIGLLHWQMRRFWIAKVLLEEGCGEGMVLKKARVSPRQAPYFMRQLKGFSRRRLEQAIEGLFHADWKLKTGQAEGPMILETWIVKVTRELISS